MACYRKGGCGPYEMCSCSECPASKPEYALTYGKLQIESDLYEYQKQALNASRHGGSDNMKPIDFNIWFIADTHLGHNNIIKYCNRPFISTDEMNETIINNWNTVVQPNDKIFMAGDFALANKNKIIEFGHRLNGRKTLILGNHDRENKKTYYEAGFEYVSRYPIIFEEFYIISHYPQFVQSNGVYINIFGHVHDNMMYKNVSQNSFCISAERLNYTPISFDEIKKRIKEENNL